MKRFWACMTGCSVCLKCMQTHHEVLKKRLLPELRTDWPPRHQSQGEVAQVWGTRCFLTAMSSRPWLQQPTHQFKVWLLTHMLIFNGCCFLVQKPFLSPEWFCEQTFCLSGEKGQWMKQQENFMTNKVQWNKHEWRNIYSCYPTTNVSADIDTNALKIKKYFLIECQL